MPLRHKLSASHNVAPVVPLDGTALMLVARQDVLAAMGEQAPPATWSDLALLTERYAARRPPGAPQSALCSTPGPRCDGSELFTAIWHSIAQTRGVRQGVYFDAGTMRPMADSAAFAATAALFARLTRLSVPPPEQQQPRGGLSSADGAGAGGCGYAHAGLRAGLCAMAVGSLELIKDVARGGGSSSVGGASNASAPAFIVVPLPGSAYVQDPTDPSRLAPCTPELCPYGEAGAARLGSQQALAVDTAALSAAAAAASGSGKQGAAELGAGAAAALAAVEMPAAAPAVCLINRAPYVPSSLLAAGVSGRIPTSEQTLAWDALTYLAGTHGSLRLMLAPGSGVGPFRNSHFGSAARAAWAAAGYEPVLASAGLDAAQAALMHANLAWGLNMMGGEFYRSALSSFLANASMATSAFPAAANTTAAVLLAEARALQHRLEEHYSPAAAYASYYSAFLTLSDVVAPAPPASDGARSSGGGSSSRAVALAVALVVAALGLLAGGVFLAKRYGCGFGTGPCRRRQRLSWRSDAPGASPRTTLLITVRYLPAADIEGSTQLWEELPELLMNEALRIHHTTLRRVLVRHRGYESATEGDSFVLAFFDPHSALAFALEAQQELLEQDWPAELLAKQGCAPMYTTVPAGFPLRRHQNTVLSRMTYSMRPYTGGGGSAAATPLPGGNACSTPNTPQMAGQSVLARLASLGRDRSLLDRSVGNAGDVPPPLRPAASMAQSPTLGRRLRNMSTGGRQRASIDFGVLQAFTSKRGFDVGAPVAAAAGAASAAATGSKSSPNNVLAAALVADDGAPPVDIFAMTASPVVPPSPSAIAAAALALVQSPHGSPRHSPRQDPAGLRRDYSLDTSSQQHMSAQQHTTQASGSDLMRGHAEMFTDGGGGFDTQALTQTQDAMEDGRALTWRSSVNNLSTAASASAGIITGLLATAEADAGAVVDAGLKAAASAALSGAVAFEFTDQPPLPPLHMPGRPAASGHAPPDDKATLKTASTAGGCGADTATAGSSPADKMGLWLRLSPSRPSAERPTGPASTTAYTAHTGSTASAWAVIHSGEAQHFLAEPSAVSPGLGHVLNHGEATAGGGATTTGAEFTAAAAAEAAELQAGGTPAFPSRNGTANGMLTPAAAGYGGATPGGGGGLLSAAALAANEPLLKLWASRGGGSRAGRRSRGGMITPSHGVSPGPAHSAFTSADRYRTGPGMLQASAAAAAAPWEVCTLESALQAAMRAFDEGTIGDRKRRLLWRGLRVRMGLHSGVASEAEVTHNRASARTVYSGEGAAVVRAVADSAQGGMVLLSEAAVDAIDAGGGLHGTAANDALLVSLGRYRIRHRDRAISLFLAASPDLAPRAALLPPPRNVTPLGLTLHHAPVGRAALAGLSLPDVAALTEWDAAATAAALGVVERVLAEQLAAHRGYLVRRDRDTGALLAAFAFPLDAVRWALHCREALAAPELEWPAGLLEHEACREGVLVNGGVNSVGPVAAAAAAAAVGATSNGGGGGSRSVGVGISGGGAGGSGCGYGAHPVAAGGSGTGAGFATTSLATGDSLIVPLPIDTPRTPASVGAGGAAFGGGGHSGCVGSTSATGMLGTAFSSRHSQRPSSARPSTSAELDSGQAALAAAAAAAMLTGATSAGSTMHGPLGGQASSGGDTALPWVSAAGTGANGAAAATGAAGGAAVLRPPWALRTSGASSGGRPSMAANSRTWGSTSRPAAAPCGCGGSGDEGNGSGPVNALHGGQFGNSRLSLQVVSTGDARAGQGGGSAGGSTARAAGASNYVSSPCGGPGNGSSPGTTDAAAVAATTAIATTSAAEEGGATPGTSPPDGSGRTLRAARLSLRSAFGDKVAALSSRWRATANSYFEVVGTGMGSAVRSSMAASGGGAGTSGCVLPDAAGSARMADQQTTLTDSAAANALFGINASEAGGGIGFVGGAGSSALGRQAGSSAGYHMCTLSVMLPLPPPPPTATALPSSTGTTPTTAIPGVGGGAGHGTGGPGTGTATATGGYSRVFAPGATAGAGVSPREATMPGSAGGALSSSAAAAAAGGGGGDGRTPKGLTVKTTGPAQWQSAEADGDGGDMFFEHLGGMDGLGPFGRAGGASTSGAFAMFGGGNGGGGGGGGPAPGPSPPLLGDYGTGLNETVVLRGPRIRVGIDCGPVDWSVSPASHTLAYTGAPATTAEKLAAAAVPGQVLATYDVMCELHRMQATLVAQRTEFGMDTAGFGGGLGGGGGGLGLGAFESLAEDGAMDSPGTASPGTAAIAAGTSGAGGAFGYRGGGGSTSLRGPAVVGVMLQPAAGRAARHRRHLVFSCRFTYDWTEALHEHDALLSRQPTGLLSAGGAGAGAGGGGIGVSGAYASAGAATGGSPHHTAAHSAALAAATPVGTPGRFSPFSSPWNWSTARLTRKRVTGAAPSASATAAAAAAAAAADRGRLSLDSRGSFDVGGMTYTFGGPASGGGAAPSTPLSSLQTAHAAAARLQQQQQWQSYAASARQAGLGGSASFAYGSSARSHAPGAGGAYYPPGALMPNTSNAAAAAAAAAGGLAAPSASPALSPRGMATDGAGFGLRRGSPATGRAPNGIAAGGAMGTAAAHGRQLPGPAACSGGSGVDGQSRLAWQTHLPPSSWAALQAAAQAQRHHQQRGGGGIALSAPCNIVATAYNPTPLQLQPPALQPQPVHKQSIHSSTIMLPSGGPSSNQTSTPLPAATASAPSADAGNGAAQFIPCAYAPTAAYSQQLARNGSGALPAALHQQEYLTAPSPSAVLTARVSASPPGSSSPRGALSAGSGATSTPLAMPPPLSRTGGSGGVAAAGTPTLPVHPRWLAPNHSLHNINHHHGGGGGSGSPPNQQYGNFALMRLARTKSGDPDTPAAAAAAAGASGSFGQGYYGFGGAAAGGGNAGDSASLRHNLQHAGTSHSLMSGSISLNANAFASSLSFGAVGLGGGGGGGSIGYMAGGGAAGARSSPASHGVTSLHSGPGAGQASPLATAGAARQSPRPPSGVAPSGASEFSSGVVGLLTPMAQEPPAAGAHGSLPPLPLLLQSPSHARSSTSRSSLGSVVAVQSQADHPGPDAGAGSGAGAASASGAAPAVVDDRLGGLIWSAGAGATVTSGPGGRGQAAAAGESQRGHLGVTPTASTRSAWLELDVGGSMQGHGQGLTHGSGGGGGGSGWHAEVANAAAQQYGGRGGAAGSNLNSAPARAEELNPAVPASRIAAVAASSLFAPAIGAVQATRQAATNDGNVMAASAAAAAAPANQQPGPTDQGDAGHWVATSAGSAAGAGSGVFLAAASSGSSAATVGSGFTSAAVHAGSTRLGANAPWPKPGVSARRHPRASGDGAALPPVAEGPPGRPRSAAPLPAGLDDDLELGGTFEVMRRPPMIDGIYSSPRAFGSGANQALLSSGGGAGGSLSLFGHEAGADSGTGLGSFGASGQMWLLGSGKGTGGRNGTGGGGSGGNGNGSAANGAAAAL
eukprot:XP_001689945.1 predicted protein [Chlamydomonas reinhardtii]